MAGFIFLLNLVGDSFGGERGKNIFKLECNNPGNKVKGDIKNMCITVHYSLHHCVTAEFKDSFQKTIQY